MASPRGCSGSGFDPLAAAGRGHAGSAAPIHRQEGRCWGLPAAARHRGFEVQISLSRAIWRLAESGSSSTPSSWSPSRARPMAVALKLRRRSGGRAGRLGSVPGAAEVDRLGHRDRCFHVPEPGKPVGVTSHPDLRAAATVPAGSSRANCSTVDRGCPARGPPLSRMVRPISSIHIAVPCLIPDPCP